MTTPDAWLEHASADARARGQDGAVPVLEAFARAMRVLRTADWNDDASAGSPAGPRDADGGSTAP
jgi:hypothetical protein